MPSGKNRNKAAPATAPTLPKRLNPIIHGSIGPIPFSPPGAHGRDLQMLGRRYASAGTRAPKAGAVTSRPLRRQVTCAQPAHPRCPDVDDAWTAQQATGSVREDAAQTKAPGGLL